MPNYYVERGFSTDKKLQPNEKATSKDADKENESETKEIPEEKVGVIIPGKNDEMIRFKQEKEGRDEVEQ